MIDWLNECFFKLESKHRHLELQTDMGTKIFVPLGPVGSRSWGISNKYVPTLTPGALIDAMRWLDKKSLRILLVLKWQHLR